MFAQRGPRGISSSWYVAVPLDSLGSSFSEALAKANGRVVVASDSSPLNTGAVEVSSRLLDFHLAAAEITDLKSRLSRTRIVSYRVPTIGPDESEARTLFEFARALNIATIVPDSLPASLTSVDRLADEFNVNVALASPTDPGELSKTLQGLSPKIGACVNSAQWAAAGLKPETAVASLNGRLMGVRLHGSGDPRLLLAIYRSGTQPTFVAVEYSGSGDPEQELDKALGAFESAFVPVAVDRLAEVGRSTPPRGEEALSEEDRAKVVAAVPAHASVKPKKARKLLVFDLNGNHPSTPFANYAIRLWAEKTHAFTPVFSNDFDNLKYPKIREYDAVFFNNAMVFQTIPDQEVRDSLLQYVREGGGFAAYHAAIATAPDWEGYGELIGVRLAGSSIPPAAIPPKVEADHQKGVVKIDDPDSPLTAALRGKNFEWEDEYYAIHKFSRDNVHVLFSLDAVRMVPEMCGTCQRMKGDVPLAWIRSYGKGRVFYTPLGHHGTYFESPELSKVMLDGIQFALGDLDSDTTPTARYRASSK
jgi:type 1 glutamine amidotransferase